jgi:hypothetical protein
MFESAVGIDGILCMTVVAAPHLGTSVARPSAMWPLRSHPPLEIMKLLGTGGTLRRVAMVRKYWVALAFYGAS